MKNSPIHIFNQQKKDILKKTDRSIQGKIDEDIREVVEIINHMPDYFTTSSCAGRIILIQLTQSRKKNEARRLFISHDPIKTEGLLDAIPSDIANPIWFMQESMILHICCRHLNAAQKMLKLCHTAGIKRVGITSLSPKICIEAFGTARMETIIARVGKIETSVDYLKVLTESANKKLEKNKEIIQKFTLLLEKQSKDPNN